MAVGSVGTLVTQESRSALAAATTWGAQPSVAWDCRESNAAEDPGLAACRTPDSAQPSGVASMAAASSSQGYAWPQAATVAIAFWGKLRVASHWFPPA